MKKLLGFSVLILSLVLLTTSCQKDNVTPNSSSLITLAELQGNWNLVSYQHDVNGASKTNCTQIGEDPATTGKISMLLSFDFENESCTITDACVGVPVPGYSVNLDIINNTLTLGSDEYVFKVQSFDKTTNTLVLKLTSVNIFGGTPPDIGGFYIVKKQS